jgi:hypothetical protein
MEYRSKYVNNFGKNNLRYDFQLTPFSKNYQQKYNQAMNVRYVKENTKNDFLSGSYVPNEGNLQVSLNT